MQWVPQKPPRRRVTLLAWGIAAIPIAFVIVTVGVVIWELLGGGLFGP